MSVSTTNLLQGGGHQAMALKPQSISGSSAVNGASYDQLSKAPCEDAMVLIANGDVSGTPDSYSLAYKIQDSADNSTFADVSGLTASSTANNTVKVIAFRPGQLRRYIRVVATPTFTGGSSPAVAVGAVLVLDRAAKAPV